jgi:DNA adenine methylase
MSPTLRKLRPLIKTHGGKAYLARRIIAQFPPHRVYDEPFAGGLSVLLNKPRAVVEVGGDLDPDVIGLYHVMQDDADELARRLALLDYSEETFDQAAIGKPTDAIDAAVRFLVRNRMSRGGLGRTFAWSERLRGGRPGDLNAWETIKAEHLWRVAERLRGVEIRHANAIDVIREHDSPGTVHYIDPPYLPATRTALATYRFEMSMEAHMELLEVLVGCEGAVVLSGYASSLYDDRLVGWGRVEIDMPNHSAQGKRKQRRVEVLWIKYRMSLPAKQLLLRFA